MNMENETRFVDESTKQEAKQAVLEAESSLGKNTTSIIQSAMMYIL